MEPYIGAIDTMMGPGKYGFIDPDSFFYGEKGGRFLMGSAGVSQQSHTPTGEPRLPVWSDKDTDDVVVAVPPDMVVRTIEEDGFNDGLVWVHRVSRDPKHWRHDRHPMEGLTMAGLWKELSNLAQEKNIRFEWPTAAVSQVAIPIYDETKGEWLQWSMSARARDRLVKQLQAKGIHPKDLTRARIHRTHDGKIEIR